MPMLVSFDKYRGLPEPTTNDFLFDKRFHRPDDLTLISYACGLSQQLKPQIHLMGYNGILTIRDLLKYTKQEFFGRFRFTEKDKTVFLSKVDAAKGSFAHPEKPIGKVGEKEYPNEPPENYLLLSYAVGSYKRFEKYIELMAYYGIATVPDLQAYVDEHFDAEKFIGCLETGNAPGMFGKFFIAEPPKSRNIFIRKMRKAGIKGLEPV